MSVSSEVLQHELAVRMDAGAAFVEVEDWIERLAVPAGRRTELWLLAWSRLPWRERAALITPT